MSLSDILGVPWEGSKINLQPSESFDSAIGKQPRAIGSVRITSKRLGDRTVLDDLRQSGCLRSLFPDSSNVDAMLLNTAGGITGGDNLNVEAVAGAKSFLTITTQAAERAYRAVGTEEGRITTSLSLKEESQLHWLPQELILYDGAKINRRLRIDMADDASLLMVEPIVFGRKAMGEVIEVNQFCDEIMIRRGDKPIYIDGLCLEGDLTNQLARPSIGNGLGAFATVVFVDKSATSMLEKVRACLPKSAGASLLADDILSLRFLATDSFLLRKHLVPVLEILRNASLPTSWRL